ncbi:MAG TPA: hypothetical protein VF756_26600 [Thermoanaerobaculia bacterium]
MRLVLIVLLAVLSVAWPAGAQAPAGEAAVRVLPSGGLQVESAALLMSGQEGGVIPLAALALPLPGESERARVPVIVEIDGSGLLAGHREPRLRLEVSVYALTAGGGIQGSRMDMIEIDLARMREAVEGSGVQLTGELTLRPGDYTLRVLVRDLETGDIGLRSLPLSVPAFRQASPALLPPVFAAPSAEAWVTARAAGSSPLALSGLSGPPVAKPVLALDEEARFAVAGSHLAAGDLAARAEVWKPGGERAADFPARLSGRQPGPAGLEVLSLAFTPSGLAPGEYELRVSIPRASSPGTRFVLVAAAEGGRVWAQLDARGSKPAARSAAASPPPAPPKKRFGNAAPVRKAYREALERLARGDEEAARAAVFQLESSLLSGKNRLTPEDLSEIELEVAHKLAETGPESLVPVAILHQRIYRDSAGRQPLLAVHSRELVLQLADLYAKRGGTPAARAMAARFILGLAAELVKTAPSSVRSRVFQRALDLDAENEAALLCRAVDFERQSKPAEAVSTLELLLRSHPQNGEARLRLALNVERLGRKGEARRLLQEIVAGQPEPWQLALAYQELGRMLVADGDLEAAERALREGLKRLPDDEKLTLQLAMIHELRQSPEQASEALQPLRPGTGESARRRYNRMPTELLDEVWSGLVRAADERRASLAAALGSAP